MRRRLSSATAAVEPKTRGEQVLVSRLTAQTPPDLCGTRPDAS